MELKKYFQIIMKRLWIIIILPLIAAATSALFSFFVLEPEYESDTTLYIMNSINSQQGQKINLDELVAGQYLVKDYRELMKSRSILTTVISELDLKGLSYDSLAGRISVNSKNDTRLIEIKVDFNDPAKAADIANKLASVFIRKATELMNIENISVVDFAVKPSAPAGPKHAANIAAAFLAGIIAAIAAVFLADYLDNTIKTTEDVEKYLGLNVLSVIPVLDTR